MDFSALSAIGPQVEASLTQSFASEPAAPVTTPAQTTSPTPTPAAPLTTASPPAPGAPVLTPGAPVTPTAPYAAPQVPQGTANPAAPVVVAPTTPAQQPQAPPAPVADQPVALQLEDAKTYLWPQTDGTTAPMTGQQIKAGFLRQADYTQKTQAAAALRKQAEEALQTVQQLASDPSQFFRYGAERFGPQVASQVLQILTQGQQPPQAAPAVPPLNPNDLATVGQAQQAAQALVQQALAQQQQQATQLQQQIVQTAQQVEQRIRDTIEVQRYNDQLSPVVKGVFDANPILTAVPHAEDTIRFEVLQRHRANPMTVEQASQAFRDVGSQYAAQLLAKAQELQKQQVVQQQQLVTQGIMPPGGAPVTQQPSFQVPQQPNGRVDWNQLGKFVTQQLDQQFQQQ